MLASTEKRLGLIAASALTAASLLMMSHQHPMTTYKVAATPVTAVVQTVAKTTLSDSSEVVMNFTGKQQNGQHVAMR